MPTEISNVITSMATTSLSFLGDVVSTFWVYILGFIFLGFMAKLIIGRVSGSAR